VALAGQLEAGLRWFLVIFFVGILASVLNTLLAGRHIWKPRLEPLTPVAK
jgi:hypothetical protein